MRFEPGVMLPGLERDPRTGIDREARRLLGAVRHDVERLIGADQLEQDLVADLYLHVRQALWERRASLARLPLGATALAEELAVAIFFAASAWRQPERGDLDHLPTLELKLAQALVEGERSETG